jgi:hypothetical protein
MAPAIAQIPFPRRPAAIGALEDEIDPRALNTDVDRGVKDASVDDAYWIPCRVLSFRGRLDIINT